MTGQVSTTISSFLFNLGRSVDSYYPRDLRNKAYPSRSIASFVNRVKAVSAPIEAMYSF